MCSCGQFNALDQLKLKKIGLCKWVQALELIAQNPFPLLLLNHIQYQGPLGPKSLLNYQNWITKCTMHLKQNSTKLYCLPITRIERIGDRRDMAEGRTARDHATYPMLQQ